VLIANEAWKLKLLVAIPPTNGDTSATGAAKPTGVSAFAQS